MKSRGLDRGKVGRRAGRRSRLAVEKLEGREVLSSVSVWATQTLNQDAQGVYYDTSYNTYTYFASGATASVASSIDYGSDGSIDFVTTETKYFESGAIEKSINRNDFNRDGQLDSIGERTYLGNGQLLTETTQFYTTGRLTYDYHFVANYRSDGTLKSTTSMTRSDTNSDGVIDFGSQESQEFNAQSRLTLNVRREDYQGDGKYDFTPYEGRWNDAGQNLFLADRVDGNRDGIADSWNESTTVYAKKTGTIQSSLVVRGQDVTGDGVVDTTSRLIKFASTGNFLSNTVSVDYGANQSIDIVTEETIYSSQRLISQVFRTDNNFDGVADQLREDSFNEQGSPTHHLEAYDFDLDGVFDIFYQRDLVFDSQFRLIDETITRREFGQESFLRDTYTYDVQGSLIELTRERDDATGHYLLRRTMMYLADGTPQTTRETYDYGNDGTIDFVSEEEQRNAQGWTVYRISRTDGNRDGVVDQFTESTYVYEGNVSIRSTSISAYDRNGDGVLDHSIVVEERSVDGLVTKTTSIDDAQGDGDYEYISIYTRTRDANFQLRREERAIDDDGDGVVDYLALEVDYNAFGDVLLWVDRADSNGDGELDYVRAWLREYDSDRRLLLERTTLDYIESDDFDSTNESIYVYADGLLLTSTQRTDQRSDGTWDSVTELVNTFDAQRRLINESLVRNTDGIEGNEYRRTVVTTYFESGELESRLATEDYGDDGDDVLVTEHLILLPGFQVVLELRQSDYDGDGLPNSIDKTENTYDELGRRVSSLSLSGFDSYPWDNVIEYFSITETTYWSNGRVHTYRSGVDINGDFELDVVPTEYELSESGVKIQEWGRSDRDFDGVLESYSSTTYDDYGLPLTSLYAWDENEDGTPDRTEERVYVWDYVRFVNLSTELRYSNDQGFSFTLIEQERAYDEAGRLTREANRFDGDRDGVLDSLDEFTIEYNAAGVPVFYEMRRGINWDGDALMDIHATITTRDDQGRESTRQELDYGRTPESPDIVLSESGVGENGVGRYGIQRVDRNVDGIEDERTTVRGDDFGRETYREFWADYDFDGEPEDYLLIESIYSEAGDTLFRRVEDITGRTYLTEYEPNPVGLGGRTTERVDNDGDGEWESITQREISFLPGFIPLDEIERFNLDADEDWDEIRTVDRTFSANGSLLSLLDSWDYDADGTADFYNRREEYDVAGRLLSSVSQQDYNRDGIADSLTLTERRWDADGNEIFAVQASDFNGDGVYEQYQKTTKEFVDLGDDLVLVRELAATVQQLGLANKTRDALLKPLNAAIGKLSDTNLTNDSGAKSDQQNFIKAVEKEVKNGKVQSVDANLLAAKARQAMLFI